MPTEILCHDEREDKSELVSFCLESPRDVFENLSMQHRIWGYEQIELPLDVRYSDEPEPTKGLVIRSADAPRGTQIVQHFSGIDFSFTETDLYGLRRPTDMKLAFRDAIYHSTTYMPDDFKEESWLDLYDLEERMGEEHDPERAKVFGYLKDIAETAFGIHKPTVADLRRF
ncbi:MAG: hypothetical protein WCI72_00125 [archaeon]